MDVIKRTIHFYQIVWLNKKGEIKLKDKSFFDDIFKHILSRVNHDDYQECLEEYKFKDEKWTWGIISKTKKTDFPLKQNLDNHELNELGLPENEGLYYPTHFGIYLGHILISEYNFEGFRAPFFLKRKINEYLKNNINEIDSVDIRPILREDIEDILISSDLREIQIAVASDNTKIFNDNNDLGIMFNNKKDIPNLGLNIGFSIDNKSNESFKDMDNIKRKIANFIKYSDISLFKKLSIKRKVDNKTEEINLLKQIFKTKEEFLKKNTKTRAIDSKDAFKKFKTIYDKNSDELNKYILKWD